MFIGEFGVYRRADHGSRVRWTQWVREEAERLGIGWCYWDLATDFGVFDIDDGEWDGPLLRALIGDRAGPL
ncbi:MAG: hypothetical protein DLM58_05535 [Pseudonocardiales bacterium]|nr:MAG: hypothetical protein DLM58_05535 [Pseudonocardiales bacterium]